MSSTHGLDPTVLRAQARVGRVLRDKWRLDRLLGVGGMAAVYAGAHRNGSKGAIKMLHLELSLEPDIKARFLREGYVANSVDHPGVVRVIDDDVADDGSVFIVMELLNGETLDARWERNGRRLPVAEVLSAVDPLLDVLVAAHEKGIIHRDIKPENVFVTHEGVVKLLDFGVARMRDAASRATRSGSTMGTPAFMPPEQALGRSSEVGPLSDVWAVGAMMYTLLSGHLVHEGETANEQLVSAATRRAPSLGTVAQALPPAVVELVDHALMFEPSRRWPSARAMQDALRAAYHAMQGSPVQTAPRLTVPDARASLPDAARPATATTGAASTAERSVRATIRRAPTAALAIGGAICLSALAAAAILVVSRPSAPTASERSPSPAPDPSAPVQVQSSPTPAPEASRPAAPAAVMSAEALPSVTGSAAFTAAGGRCKQVIVAGVGYGATPTEVQLAPGDYLAVCESAGGRTTQAFQAKSEGRVRVVFNLAKRVDPVDPRDIRKR